MAEPRTRKPGNRVMRDPMSLLIAIANGTGAPAAIWRCNPGGSFLPTRKLASTCIEAQVEALGSG